MNKCLQILKMFLSLNHTKQQKIDKMKAQDLKVGTKINYGKGIITEVTSIENINQKTITYRTKRIYPDLYNGNFFHRQKLNTEISTL